MKENIILKLLAFFLPVVIAVGMGSIFFQNYLYNTKQRTHQLTDGELSDGIYHFDDIALEVTTRGGDTGSWLKDKPTYDDEGNEVFYYGVGTIYEVVVYNKSPNILRDWEMTVYMPEDLMLNNSWNGELDIHQFTGTDKEASQFIDIADYSKYDIKLVYYMDAVGPMIPMKAGDFFIYHPDDDMNERPIGAAKKDSEELTGIRIGFITYIADQSLDYVADFTNLEFRYYMQANILVNPLFWVFIALFIVWLVIFFSRIIVKANIKHLLEMKKRDEQIIEQTMNTFVNFIEAKDPNTMGHSLRVAIYTSMLAESMGLSEEECKNYYYIALMHDCGKILIPDGILNKPAKLTDEEYAIMKKHTIYGSEMLRDFTSIENIQLGAKYHHERYDGSGYPSGIKGEDIPLVARIICVSDAFDAMNSQRCYRKNLTSDVILNELNTHKGKQFDPNVVDHLLALIDSGKIKFS